MIHRQTRLSIALLATLALALPAGAQTPTPPVPDTQPVPQPPETKTTPLQIYASLNGQQAGPFSAQAITEMAAKGQIDAQTLVWSGELNMTGWQPAGQVPAIAALLKTASPLPGPPPLPEPDPATYLPGTWSTGAITISVPDLDFPLSCAPTMQYTPDGRVTGGCPLIAMISDVPSAVVGEMRIEARWTAETVAGGKFMLRYEGNTIATARSPDGRTSTEEGPFNESSLMSVLSQDQMMEETDGTLWNRGR